MILLAACGSNENESAAIDNSDGTTSNDQLVLDDDYENALSVAAQLALGTVQLEETDNAVNEAQAETLIPLWQALQSLSNSDTAADVELQAVTNQIQESMTVAQIQAIFDMKLTTDSLAELAQEGGFGRGLGGFARGAGQDGQTEGDFQGGGFRGGGPGGGPGGGIIIGGFPGGGPEGGFPGGGFGNLDEDALATRQAEFASGTSGFQDLLMMNMVIRLLQTKTGEIVDNQGANPAGVVFTAVSEALGLNIEKIRAQWIDGATLADVITNKGGDVSVVRETIISALKELPDAANLDAEQLADDWLNSSRN